MFAAVPSRPICFQNYIQNTDDSTDIMKLRAIGIVTCLVLLPVTSVSGLKYKFLVFRCGVYEPHISLGKHDVFRVLKLFDKPRKKEKTFMVIISSFGRKDITKYRGRLLQRNLTFSTTL